MIQEPATLADFGYTERLFELREQIAEELDGGASRDELLHRLDAERHELESQGLSRDADLISDVIEFAEGWCSPQMRI